MTRWETVLAIAGLAVITALTRSFFMLPRRELPLPSWLREGLRYAPLAALVAIIAPEVLMTDGHLIDTWRDARLYAVLTAVAWYAWRRSILGTIVSGSVVMVALRVGLGW